MPKSTVLIMKHRGGNIMMGSRRECCTSQNRAYYLKMTQTKSRSWRGPHKVLAVLPCESILIHIVWASPVHSPQQYEVPPPCFTLGLIFLCYCSFFNSEISYLLCELFVPHSFWLFKLDVIKMCTLFSG